MGDATDIDHASEVLWRHEDPSSTPMWRFLQHVKGKHGLQLRGYPDLFRWSVDNVSAFWEETWDFVGITASQKATQVQNPSLAIPLNSLALPLEPPMYPRPDFFSGARLNFAENLLFPAVAQPPDPSAAAVLNVTELCGVPRSTSWAQLREAVRQCSGALRSSGIVPGDVIAGYVSNHVEAVVAMLSAAAVGASWTSISPDSGVSAVLDRLAQIAPKILFADNGTLYNGKQWSSTAKTVEIVAELAKLGLRSVVIISNIECATGVSQLRTAPVKVYEYTSFLAAAPSTPLVFEQLPPSHPLYILYSSGTTGLPKPIVHTALGTFIQHKKEHLLHCSLSASSRMLYYTTTSWMMWHWSVSALAVGASVVLYSGSPFRPRSHLSLLWLLSNLKVTHFGTSAAYLTALETNKVRPASEPDLDLSSLEAIYSTASPLPPSTFRYIYNVFPKMVNLASITGGTDIISLFGAPCPLLPVRAGAIQCAGLGMDIRVVDSASGAEVPPGEPGDLVCVKPFPCQPLTFFGADGDTRYRTAYFERFRDICGVRGPAWHHGDFVKMLDATTGSLVMLGRSDGVLKPAGVRFGSAEIYNMLTRFFASEVEDSVCVGRRREAETDETVCLFVVMAPGKAFSDDLRARIKTKVRSELSPRHVPGVIEEARGGIPKTSNGKKIEVAVKQVLSGLDVKINASVANPEALDWFKAWAKDH